MLSAAWRVVVGTVAVPVVSGIAAVRTPPVPVQLAWVWVQAERALATLLIRLAGMIGTVVPLYPDRVALAWPVATLARLAALRKACCRPTG